MKLKRRELGETADNTVFVAHFVRPNWLTPTSQAPRMLGEIGNTTVHLVIWTGGSYGSI